MFALFNVVLRLVYDVHEHLWESAGRTRASSQATVMNHVWHCKSIGNFAAWYHTVCGLPNPKIKMHASGSGPDISSFVCSWQAGEKMRLPE